MREPSRIPRSMHGINRHPFLLGDLKYSGQNDLEIQCPRDEANARDQFQWISHKCQLPLGWE